MEVRQTGADFTPLDLILPSTTPAVPARPRKSSQTTPLAASDIQSVRRRLSVTGLDSSTMSLGATDGACVESDRPQDQPVEVVITPVEKRGRSSFNSTMDSVYQPSPKRQVAVATDRYLHVRSFCIFDCIFSDSKMSTDAACVHPSPVDADTLAMIASGFSILIILLFHSFSRGS